MAWTPPSYVAAGEADPAHMNVEVIDNLIYLKERFDDGFVSTFVPTTTWTGAGGPSVSYTIVSGLVIGDFRWTLLGTPAGGDLGIELPLPAFHSTQPIGIVSCIGITGYGIGLMRTYTPGDEFVIVDTAGTPLSSALGGLAATDVINGHFQYRAA